MSTPSSLAPLSAQKRASTLGVWSSVAGTGAGTAGSRVGGAAAARRALTGAAGAAAAAAAIAATAASSSSSSAST